MSVVVRIATCALALAMATPVVLADADVTLEQVPTRARSVIAKHVGHGTIHEIEREQRGRQTVYEVEYRDARGAKYEMVVAANGRILAQHRE